ncbi:aldolase/citrate lyase family protein [Alkalibacillus haloalkaliphilus]|uniref:aldolase/citrate lyase family protein n=1 Tax=Alkalibacillus haloalkaliphilus TaxID=94136 RepID=UPI002935F789|nr:aldolase/citrate lyase family protein [Alkalibacillus haloalkaliphilus]MDV2582158.1 aldolase/citrate lyase family protein [Alkalibacillus haloalkaliphilus]
MPLNLMYITNREDIALVAEKSGVDWIFIDLEINGKESRQGHLDTVISKHNISDVSKVSKVLTKSELLVRVNPIFDGSKKEIEQVIDNGADIVMLPFFKTKEEVETFVRHVDGKARTCLLLETPEAVKNIDSILSVEGVDMIHIGLNDLHLGYNMNFMFELLADGTVEMLCNKISEKNVPYGFGGIARLGQGNLPAEKILAEHYRLGSSMAILSRSFYKTDEGLSLAEAKGVFYEGVKEIREYESLLMSKELSFYKDNINSLKQTVEQILNASAR